jgi:hypothetical protein
MASPSPWQYGGALLLGIILGPVSVRLAKIAMYVVWLVVLVNWTTLSAYWQPSATRGWWSSIVLWLVALGAYEGYLAVVFAHLGQTLAWQSLALGVVLTVVLAVPVAALWHRIIRTRHLARTINQ